MEQLKNSEKTTEVAEPFLLKLDLQFFSDELGGDDGGDDTVIVDDNLDADIDNDLDTGDDEEIPGGNNQDVADPEQPPSFKDDPQNKAFAEMRRRAEQAERDSQIARKYGADYGIFSEADIVSAYGESHGIQTLQEFENALKMEAYRQQGLDPDAINSLIDNHPAVKEAIKEKQDRFLLDNYFNLQKEYPELVKNEQDIQPEVWKKWNDGKTGLTLTEAFELVNKQSIREHLQASSKQKALNQVNSKAHIRGNGGEGADDVDLTSIPSETMQAYRQMFAKELRTGKMKESDFVKHYKKSQKG
jgi:hypothetical protein